jgi:ribosomal protein S27AE
MQKRCPECGALLDENGVHPYNSPGSTPCGQAPLPMKGKRVVGDCPLHGPYYASEGETVTSCPNCAKGRPPFR